MPYISNVSLQDNATFVEQSFNTEVSATFIYIFKIFGQFSQKFFKTPCETSSLLHALRAVYLWWDINEICND